MILLIIFVCMIAAGFFAGIESGLVSTDRFLLESEERQGRLSVRAARFLLSRPERLLSTTLIGTNISVVTAGVMLNSAIRMSSMPYLSIPGSLALSVLLLIFSEIIPKTYFRRNANTVSVQLSLILVPCYLIFIPVAIVLNAASRLTMVLLGQGTPSNDGTLTKQDLRLHVRLGSVQAGIPVQDQMLVEDIFDFQETMAREVMSQIHEIRVCRIGQSVKDLVEYALTERTEIVPICEQRIDDILGYVDINEVVRSPEQPIRHFLRKARIFPDTKHIPQLLSEMNRVGDRAVFLANEYGRVTGLITPEHIVSEIIGYTPGTPDSGNVENLGPGAFRVAGVVDIEDFQNLARIRIPKGPYDTVGGYVSDKLGRIPEAGEELTFRDPTMTIRVESREPTRIQSMVIEIRKR